MKAKNLIDRNREDIALKTLKMTPQMQGVMGGPNADEAIKFLKSIGYNDIEIKKLSESNGTIKLKSLVPEEIDEVSPIDGMRKQQAIKYITKNFKVYDKLKGFFNDEYWKPINGIINDIQTAGIPFEIDKTEYQKENGIPSRKIWWCSIPFTNQNQRPDRLNVIITAAGAGSISDPLSRYDVTFVIN